MRYYRNDEFFVRGGPIFIYCEGEWTISPYSLQRGHMVDMERELSGQMFYTEHRYYGLSHPTPDASVHPFFEHRTGTSRLGTFHYSHPNETFRIRRLANYYGGRIVFGDSRCVVPSEVSAFERCRMGLKCSDVLFVKPDNFEYKEIVGASIRSVGGEECYRRLERAFRRADDLFANRNFAEFSRIFRTCDEMNDDNPYDIQIMFYTLSELLAGLVQGHRSGDIEGFCSTLIDPAFPDETDLDAFVRWYTRRVFGNNPSPDDCAESTFDGNVELHRNETWGSTATNAAMRQWFFQTCNEFGWFETSASRFQPFGSRFPADKLHRWCSDVYGDEFTAATLLANTERKNTIYGGFNPNVNNVYFTHGRIDPWRITGVQHDVNEHSPVDIIPDASHCNDLSSNLPGDSPRMREVRDRILHLSRVWSNTNE